MHIPHYNMHINHHERVKKAVVSIEYIFEIKII